MNVTVVAGICVRYDAISDAVVDQLRALRASGRVSELRLVAQGIDRDPTDLTGVETTTCDDPWRLTTSIAVDRSDLVVFHWGISYELFDAIGAIAQRRRVAVHFHNVTPAELLTGIDRAKSTWSLQQLANLVDVPVELWTYSVHNRDTLIGLGLDAHRIHDVPIAVERPTTATPRARRRDDEFGMLAVGRAVPAKGLHVLVDALAAASELPTRTRLTIAGNLALGDGDYAAALRERIARLTGVTVQLIDRPTTPALWDLYDRHHVVVSPSFHEGLCIPVIEGYIAGCRAIGTTAGNLPYVVVPPDAVVPPGDVEALADAIQTLGRESVTWHGGVTWHDDAQRAAAAALAASYSRRAVDEALENRLRTQDAFTPPSQPRR